MRTLRFCCSLLALFFLSQQAFAQISLIALHHQGNHSFYTNLDSAYTAAVDGDTLYLPGGTFGDLTLEKSLAIIGVGYHPDSTLVTGQTILDDFILKPGADSSSIIGIYFTGSLRITNETIYNVKLMRCFLNSQMYLSNSILDGWLLAENWISNIYFTSSAGFKGGAITNNIIKSLAYGFSGSDNDLLQIKNNILISGSFNCNSCVLSNNVFGVFNHTGNTSNSNYNNNLNSGVNGSNGDDVGLNNYLVNLALDSIFVNYSNPGEYFGNDFHLANSTYTGTDGQPVGIYGGLFPWKEGGLPFNPHISEAVISNATDSNGNLQINIKVRAQSN